MVNKLTEIENVAVKEFSRELKVFAGQKN